MLLLHIFFRLFVTISIVTTSFTSHAQSTADSNKRISKELDDYPIPSENPDMLFYLQRSLDLNSVIYATKYAEVNGRRRLNEDQPVNIYWLINDKTGSTKPLSKVQHFGYGVRSDVVEGQMQIKLVAYREMPIFLKHSSKDDKYHAHVSLEGKDVLLTKVFINIDGGTKLKPNVTYIEISGTDTQTGKKTIHRITP